VIAPSLVPTKAGDRVKTDRRDAEKADGATSVGQVPAASRPPARGLKAWTKKYLEWVKTHVHFDQPVLEVTLADYLEEVDHVAARIVKLEKAMDEAVRQAPPEIRAVIEPLQALLGVAQTTAATIVSELGSVSRFQSPRQLMGYSGLVAREHSSGNRVRRGGITKTGNSHLRRVLVEAAWAYQHRPNVTGFLLLRQKNLALSDEVKKMAWKAQQRLHQRYKAMVRGKNKNQIVMALGRELLGFIWAIALETEKQFKLAQAVHRLRPNPRAQSEAAPDG
jgi:transposase